MSILVFGMNVLPAFAPPTWLVLAFFYKRFHLSLLVVVLLGATSAVSGRVVLALLARHNFRLFLPKSSRENLDTLGKYLESHAHLTIPIVLAYAFFPIPSNFMFIAAGLSELNLTMIAVSFFIGRLISYTFWISATTKVSSTLNKVFAHYYSDPKYVIVEIVGFVMIYLLSRIRWKKLFKRGS